MNRRIFNQCIEESDFKQLFISEMGWNNPHGQTAFDLEFDDLTYSFHIVAERNGFQVMTCGVRNIPTSSFCKKLDTRLRRAANDYICIFHLPESQHHLWAVPVKKVEKRDIVLVEYASAEAAGFLFEKVNNLSFDLGQTTTITDVVEKVRSAFLINSERITKDFYTGFKKEHTKFAQLITGIDDHIADKDNRNKQWYTSVMLNRMMFCYFIQKKGFLDGDVDYLRQKLERHLKQTASRSLTKAPPTFFTSFYKDFLITLFHDGLNAPKHDTEFEHKYGRIPYLNGGMFDIHQIEQEYEKLDIDDQAFVSLFGFFDKWHWHLDDRITASGRDINPDVLGYIFEQYINDRAQMGAYYTKEDITEYIGRNTIVPYLMDAVKSKDEALFAADADLWCFLRDSGDRYLFDAVKKGAGLEIPEEIAVGIDTAKPNLLERRKRWNERTPEPFALPTEIWRETIERLQRCDDIKSKIEKGEVTEINDFITYNLDIRSFIYDYLNITDNPLFVENFYEALQRVTVLDPTCGSGAFLFAALNILEPLYEVCIARMQEFHAKDKSLFGRQLDEIKGKYRSNIQYFIYKSIILRNLYGVDIMVEATEIAKLRLFLKMVAVVDVDRRDPNMGLDPLPDIDFNIRCGNTLVGYATEKALNEDLDYGDPFAAAELRPVIRQKMGDIAQTYQTFRELQLVQTEEPNAFRRAKQRLRKDLDELNGLLNRKLYQSTASAEALTYNRWLGTHQPFHWLAEFYEIINGNGGFDVVIGNPPYVEYSKRNVNYRINNYSTMKCANLYAFTFERASEIAKRTAMIVQMSSVGTDAMKPLQMFLRNTYSSVYYGCFPERPKQLFDGACIALSIIICNEKGSTDCRMMGAGVYRTSELRRNTLFQTIQFISIPDQSFLDGYSLYPKFQYEIEKSIIQKLLKDTAISKYTTSAITSESISYRTAGGRYWKIVINRPFATESTSNKTKYINRSISSNALVAILNSNLMWWYYVKYFDLYNFKDYMIFNFRYTDDSNTKLLSEMGKELMLSYESHKIVNTQYIKSKDYESVFESFNPQLSKPIIDEIDKVLAAHYGFTEEELDFIINYDIKYRMGDELEN